MHDGGKRGRGFVGGEEGLGRRGEKMGVEMRWRVGKGGKSSRWWRGETGGG